MHESSNCDRNRALWEEAEAMSATINTARPMVSSAQDTLREIERDSRERQGFWYRMSSFERRKWWNYVACTFINVKPLPLNTFYTLAMSLRTRIRYTLFCILLQSMHQRAIVWIYNVKVVRCTGVMIWMPYALLEW